MPHYTPKPKPTTLRNIDPRARALPASVRPYKRLGLERLELVERDERSAVYLATPANGGRPYYEGFLRVAKPEIVKRDDGTIDLDQERLVERYPRDEEFGARAWTRSDLRALRDKLAAEVEKRAIERVS